MSQQEFESSQEDQSGDEAQEPQSRYSWSRKAESKPRDEPPGGYGESEERGGQASRSKLPWWASPQTQQNNPRSFVLIMVFIFLVCFITGVLGVVGVILGSLAHLLGVILGALFALFIFAILLVFLIFILSWRWLSRAAERRSRRTNH